MTGWDLFFKVGQSRLDTEKREKMIHIYLSDFDEIYGCLNFKKIKILSLLFLPYCIRLILELEDCRYNSLTAYHFSELCNQDLSNLIIWYLGDASLTDPTLWIPESAESF